MGLPPPGLILSLCSNSTTSNGNCLNHGSFSGPPHQPSSFLSLPVVTPSHLLGEVCTVLFSGWWWWGVDTIQIWWDNDLYLQCCCIGGGDIVLVGLVVVLLLLWLLPQVVRLILEDSSFLLQRGCKTRVKSWARATTVDCTMAPQTETQFIYLPSRPHP